jgi:WD40 repeat protein
VGGKDGSFTVLKFSKEMEVVTRPDGSAVDIKHCVETIDAIKFSPDGARLAVGSHDNFIDLYDTAGDRFTRLGRCQVRYRIPWETVSKTEVIILMPP